MDPAEFMYLRGEMPVCKYAGCDRPTKLRDADYCTRCLERIRFNENQAELKDAKNAPSRAWYYIPKTCWLRSGPIFICLTCEQVYDVITTEVVHPAKTTPPTPIIGCCTHTRRCAAAKEFWGSDNDEPELTLQKYQRADLTTKTLLLASPTAQQSET